MEDPMETAVPDALEGLQMSSANRRLPEELCVSSQCSQTLETLSFGNNPASAAAKQAAKDALKQRASRS